MKIKTLMMIFTVLLFFMFGPAASAEEQVKKEEKKKEEKKEPPPIIVEVVEVSKRIPEDTFKTDRSVSVLDKKSIKEQNPRTIPEALTNAPGVFVQHTNSGGGSPIIRGMVGPQVLIAVDGIRFNNSTYRTGPVQYLNLIDPYSVDQVEVLRGPGSVLYGSDAMGGVIRLNSLTGFSPNREGQNYFTGNLMSRYQSVNNGSTLHGHFSAGSKGWSFLSGYSYKHYNDLHGGKGIGLQPYSGYDSTSAIGKLNRHFSKGFFKDWDFTVGYLYSFIDNAGRTDKLYDKNSLQMYDNIDHLVYARLKTLFPAIATSGSLTLSYQDFVERKDNHKVPDDYKTILNTTTDDIAVGTIGLDLNMSTGIKENVLRLNYGGMWYRDSVNAGRFTQLPGADPVKVNEQNFPDGSTYSNFGLYTLLEWDPFHSAAGNIFRLGGGWRFHGVSADVPAGVNLPAVDFSFTGHVFLLSAQYLSGDNYNMSLTFSQGFRAPNLNESALLGDTGQYFHIPNHQLRPEYSNTVELMARGRLGTISLAWAGYVSFLKDFINRVPTLWEGNSEIDGKSVVHNINAGKGLLWGTEGGFFWGISGNWSLAGNVTYTYGEEEVPGEENVPFRRIPPLFGQFKVRYDFQGHGSWQQGFVESYVLAAAKQDRLSPADIKDNRIPEGGTPGWWTWNFRIGVSLWSHIRCNIAVDNLLDKGYKYHGSGVYSPGTSVVFTVEVY